MSLPKFGNQTLQIPGRSAEWTQHRRPSRPSGRKKKPAVPPAGFHFAPIPSGRQAISSPQEGCQPSKGSTPRPPRQLPAPGPLGRGVAIAAGCPDVSNLPRFSEGGYPAPRRLNRALSYHHPDSQRRNGESGYQIESQSRRANQPANRRNRAICRSRNFQGIFHLLSMLLARRVSLCGHCFLPSRVPISIMAAANTITTAAAISRICQVARER